MSDKKDKQFDKQIARMSVVQSQPGTASEIRRRNSGTLIERTPDHTVRIPGLSEKDQAKVAARQRRHSEQDEKYERTKEEYEEGLKKLNIQDMSSSSLGASSASPIAAAPKAGPSAQAAAAAPGVRPASPSANAAVQEDQNEVKVTIV